MSLKGMENGIKGNIRINRSVYDIDDINNLTNYKESKFKWKCPKCRCKPNINCLVSFIPPIEWIATYSWKEYFLLDLFAGICQFFLHIPQGLAYGLLAGYEAINGIYTQTFPQMIYVIFGSSRHISMGSYAIVALLMNQAIKDRKDIICDTSICGVGRYTAIQIGSAMTFYTGIIQIILWALRFGVLTTILSPPFISAFTAAAAWHIIASQFPDLFGVITTPRGGIFNFYLTLYDFFKKIHTFNGATLIVSTTCITILILNNEFLKPWWSTKSKYPIPIELLLLVFGNLISYLASFASEGTKIRIVGYIQVGIPSPSLPEFNIFQNIILSTIPIVLVSYGVTMSWNITFAKQCHTLVDANQELFAMGLSNVFGSFFECFPICASLTKTLLTVKIGGRTQLGAFISVLFLLILMAWMGPFFEHLPRAILASVIISTMRYPLSKMLDVKKFWLISKFDFSIWIVTFSSCLVLNVDYGLFIGIVYSIITLVITTFSPRMKLLGSIPKTEIYLEDKYDVTPLDKIVIIGYNGELTFTMKDLFLHKLKMELNFDVIKYVVQQRYERRGTSSKIINCLLHEVQLKFKVLILDLSGVTHLDPTGCDCLTVICEDFTSIKVRVLISGLTSENYYMLQHYKNIYKIDYKFLLFPTTHDAVIYAQDNFVMIPHTSVIEPENKPNKK